MWDRPEPTAECFPLVSSNQKDFRTARRSAWGYVWSTHRERNRVSSRSEKEWICLSPNGGSAGASRTILAACTYASVSSILLLLLLTCLFRPRPGDLLLTCCRLLKLPLLTDQGFTKHLRIPGMNTKIAAASCLLSADDDGHDR